MDGEFQTRWVSRGRADSLRKAGPAKLGQAVLLQTLTGWLIVEPVGSDLGDGPVLSAAEADYELQAAWHVGPHARLREARQKMGLEAPQPVGAGA